MQQQKGQQSCLIKKNKKKTKKGQQAKKDVVITRLKGGGSENRVFFRRAAGFELKNYPMLNRSRNQTTSITVRPHFAGIINEFHKNCFFSLRSKAGLTLKTNGTEQSYPSSPAPKWTRNRGTMRCASFSISYLGGHGMSFGIFPIVAARTAVASASSSRTAVGGLEEEGRAAPAADSEERDDSEEGEGAGAG